MTLHPQFVTDRAGNKSAVLSPIKEYDKLMEELEDAEDVRLYDAAKASKQELIPIDKAFEIIESKRKSKK